ncbi:MAG: hypothetical protein ABWY92_18085 [Xanthobacteraceae bacterium]|jgi:hypothetical protein
MNELHTRVVRVGLALCVMQGATIAAAIAGPCSTQIEQIDKALSQSGSKWNVGPTGQQTTAAQRHVQPTPQSVEQAQQSAQERLNALLARARSLDAAGDGTECAKVVEQIRMMTGLQ